jgi:hypothetical protein
MSVFCCKYLLGLARARGVMIILRSAIRYQLIPTLPPPPPLSTPSPSAFSESSHENMFPVTPFDDFAASPKSVGARVTPLSEFVASSVFPSTSAQPFQAWSNREPKTNAVSRSPPTIIQVD